FSVVYFAFQKCQGYHEDVLENSIENINDNHFSNFISSIDTNYVTVEAAREFFTEAVEFNKDGYEHLGFLGWFSSSGKYYTRKEVGLPNHISNEEDFNKSN